MWKKAWKSKLTGNDHYIVIPNHQIIISVNDYSECYLWDISFYFYLDLNYFLKSSILPALCVRAYSAAQSCQTLYHPMDWSPPGSSVHGILRLRILEWVVIPFSWESSQPRDRTQVSHIAGGFLDHRRNPSLYFSKYSSHNIDSVISCSVMSDSLPPHGL